MGENLHLCMGCMNPIGDSGKCNTCGYTDKTPYLPSYLPPKTLLDDRYIVGKLLSYNGEGALYVGYDKVTNEKVLVKEYMPDTLCSRVKGSSVISVNPNTLAQYKTYMSEFTELNKLLSRMRTLSHINPAVDLFSQNNTTYVILEYIEGISLRQYMQKNAGELTWEQVKKLFPPIFTTLSLIHNAGIVHRGISLDTIYVTQNGELKLTGFSIATVRTANTELASELFAGYAAPEQYSSSNWQGTWTDVYSISAVLYRILTGCMPTEAVSRIGNDNLLEPAKINTNIPANVSKVIMSAMRLSSEVRVQTITELVTKLFEQPEFMELPKGATQTIPIQKTQKKVAVTPKQASRRDPRIVPFIIGGAFLIIFIPVFLIVLMLSGGDNTDESSLRPTLDSSSYDDSDVLSDTDVSEDDSSDLASSVSDSSEDDKPVLFMLDLIGKDFERIKKQDEIKKWLNFDAKYDYSDEFAKGTIMEQSIPAETEINENTKVQVKVSLGPRYVEVPEYEGMSKKSYLAKLSDLGIKYEDKTEETDEVLADYVVSTSKAVGEKIDLKKAEVLIVYIAVAPIEPE